jgi:hypothetical protein
MLILGPVSSPAAAESGLAPDLDAAEAYLKAQMQRHRFKGMALPSPRVMRSFI